METVLTVGLNTRSVVCSLKRLGFQVNSADYFGCLDLRNCADKSISMLIQAENKSCHKLTDNFRSDLLEQIALELVDKTDHVICLSGVKPQAFPSDKIRGNDGYFDDKAIQYKALRSNFHLPLTFIPSSFKEAGDIASSHPEYKFLLKPNHGSGGYGVQDFKEKIINWKPGDFLLQQFLPGKIISASVLSTDNQAKTIITSENLINKENPASNQPYVYQGNISPHAGNDEIKRLAEEIVLHLGLVGSNGVDFVINNDEIHVLEVNPRIQGTFECAELALDINMAEAHLAACEDKLIEVNKPNKFVVKRVYNAPETSHVGNLNLPFVHDIPLPGVIIESGEPVCTVLVAGKNLDNCLNKTRSILENINQKLTPSLSL